MDGQHRLWAIIEADKTITMHVWFNIGPEALLAIDSGKSRSMVDILRLGGQAGEVNINDVAVLRAMLGGYHNPPALTPQETSVSLCRHRDAIRFAIEHLRPGPPKGICNAVTRAVLARAYYGVHHEQLAKFSKMLTTGIVLDTPAATVLVTLRQYLIIHRGFSLRERRERYGKTERALIAFLRREPIRKLVSANREYFPLPEEVTH